MIEKNVMLSFWYIQKSTQVAQISLKNALRRH